MPVSALAPKELKPFREREPSWRRQSPSRSGSLSSGYRWFESISLQRRVLCEPDSLDQDGENLPSGFKLASSNSRRWRKTIDLTWHGSNGWSGRLQALEDAAAIR